MADNQRDQHEKFIAECEAKGVCAFSGLKFEDCMKSICDCFREQFPDDPYGLHPEVFIVRGETQPE